MRQLDLFQPVEIAKPQSNATTSKVNGEVHAMPVQPAKNGVGLSE